MGTKTLIKGAEEHLLPSHLTAGSMLYCGFLGRQAPLTTHPDRMVASTHIVLNIEVAASLQQDLDHSKMTFIGSEMQGGPAMLLMQSKHRFQNRTSKSLPWDRLHSDVSSLPLWFDRRFLWIYPEFKFVSVNLGYWHCNQWTKQAQNVNISLSA